MAQIVPLSKVELSICIQSIEATDWQYAGGAEVAKGLVDKLKQAYVKEHKREAVGAAKEAKPNG